MINKVTKVAAHELLAMHSDLGEIREGFLKEVSLIWNDLRAAAKSRRVLKKASSSHGLGFAAKAVAD